LEQLHYDGFTENLNFNFKNHLSVSEQIDVLIWLGDISTVSGSYPVQVGQNNQPRIPADKKRTGSEAARSVRDSKMV